MNGLAPSPSSHSDRKRICLVTGATRGIGHGVAIDMARRGFRTVIVARNRESAEKARETVVAASKSDDVHALVGDLASQAQVRAVAAAFFERFDHLDVLINNAAVFEGKRSETEERIERHWAINYLAPFLLTHLLLPALRAASAPRIVNVSGETARLGTIRLHDLERKKSYSTAGAYAQSKLAQIMLTKTLAERLEGQVTVNALHPGMVATDHLANGPALLNRFWSTVLPKPQSAVNAVVRLSVSPKLAQVTGAYYLGRIRFFAPFSVYRRSLREALYAKSVALTNLDSCQLAPSVSRAPEHRASPPEPGSKQVW